jgi:hypothetical protein
VRKKESKSVYVKKDKKDNKSVRPVICLNNEQKFETMRSAADFYNIDMTGISRACSRGKERYTSGKDKDGNALHWMYYKDYLEKIETEGPDYAKNRLKQWEEKKIAKEQKRLEKMHKVKKPRQVICLNTLEVYDDALKAATICKTHRSSIYESLREGGRYFTSGVDSKGNPMQWMDYKEYMTKIENGEPIRPRQDIHQYLKLHTTKIYLYMQ